MTGELFQELKFCCKVQTRSFVNTGLKKSHSNKSRFFSDLISLLHGQKKTAQRFTWLIGDLLETNRSLVIDSLPMLFELRDQMPFPGMQRTVAKCLWYLQIPKGMEAEAIAQLFKWLSNDKVEIGVKHYASKALYELALESRIDIKQLLRVLEKQTKYPNKSYATRTEKLRMKLQRELRS